MKHVLRVIINVSKFTTARLWTAAFSSWIIYVCVCRGSTSPLGVECSSSAVISLGLSPSEDHRFSGRGRTLGSARNQSSTTDSDSSLQARLLDNNTPNSFSETAPGQRIPDARHRQKLLLLLLMEILLLPCRF